MITGTLLSLRAPVEADLPAIAALRNDMALQASVMGTPHPNTPAMARDWMASRLADPRTIFFVVAEAGTDQACGYVMIAHVDPLHGHGELGICLGPAHQGKGYGREALRLVEGYGRDVFGLRKVLLRVLASNAPARALYEKVGYDTVGIHRSHFYFEGRHHDVVVMEKLLPAAGEGSR